MAFKSKDDVVVLSCDDTGEVKNEKSHRVYIVARDFAKADAEHIEDDLRLLPFTGRVSYQSYFKIVRAERVGANRKLEIALYSKTGGRIR